MSNERPDKAAKTYDFLQGGGEMRELTRRFDWSKTPVGSPDRWPVSLRTIVATTLSTKAPMFLWWGEDLIQFYNDGYRPSFGKEGKHPMALGQRGADCWPEIWEIIYPLIHQVLTTGEATWNEDLLVPIYRNGKVEDVYWTFGYSPVLNDANRIEGVLVVCSETTEKVQYARQQAESRRLIEESEERFRTMAEGTNILVAVADATSNATYFNKAWADLTGRPVADLLAFGWVDLVHPEDKARYVKIYLDAFEKKEPFTGEFRVLNKDGGYTWLLAQGPPRFRADGSFAGYISSCVDITGRKKNEEQIRSLVDSAPFPIGVYTGKELRIELANHAMLAVWGKGGDMIGRSYREILPELTGQAIFEELDGVFTSGKPFHSRNRHIQVEQNGRLESFYFNYSFTPLVDSSGQVYGVMNTGADVTDLNLAKKKVEENEKNFRNTILKAPVAICIFKGPKYVVEIANDRMLELWGKNGGRCPAQTHLRRVAGSPEPGVRATAAPGLSHRRGLLGAGHPDPAAEER
jgi:PAS domain S-box-containing protein